MKVLTALLSGVLGLAGFAGPALAQVDAAPPVMRQGAQVDRLFARLANCVVRGQKDETSRLFDIEPGSPASNAAVMDLLRGAALCEAPRMTDAHILTWRGAFAEALYLRTAESTPAVAVADAADRPAWLQKPAFALYDVAQCAAERSPEAADRVVRSERRSTEEAAAVAALLPTLQACGHGRKINFNRVTIHGVVAEGLLRARGGSPAGAGKQ